MRLSNYILYVYIYMYTVCRFIQRRKMFNYYSMIVLYISCHVYDKHFSDALF